MSKPTVLLRCGNATLDLNDQSTYYLAQDFVPPATAYTPQFTDGTSANRLQGGAFVSKRATNRSFSFTVAVKGASSGKINQAIRAIKIFLSKVGQFDPLYLEYNPNTVIEPVWGQLGANLHYEIVFGNCVLADGYMVGVRRAEDVNVTIALTLKPFALGQQQRLCSVVGGVLEDTWGSADGLSRGVIIPEATTNKMTNPVFGHATFGNGWTAGANLTATENTDPQYMLPGTVKSAKLQRTGAANTYTQSINVGNTNTHVLGVFIKRHDGAALVTSGGMVTEVELLYGASSVQVPAQSMGNGWYWLKWQYFSGIASAQNVGVTVVTYEPIYLAVIQLEEKAYCTWPCWGDLLGCAWTGTAHASTSTRTLASCKLPISGSVINRNTWSIRAVVRFDAPNTTSTQMVILDLRDAGNPNAPILYYEPTGDFITLRIGGVPTYLTYSVTFSAGAIYIIHATANSGTVALYVNGVSVDTDTNPLPSFGANLFIGSLYDGSVSLLGAIIDLATYDCTLSTTEVANDYANLAPLVSDGKIVGSIPWLWTKDGDDIVDNYYDATHNMHCVCGSIPGSADALTNINATTDENATGFNIYQSLYKVDAPVDVSDFFDDLSGTVDAAALGGNAAVVNVSTGSTYTLLSLLWKNFKGGSFALLIRSKDAGSNLSLKATYTIGGIYFEESEANKVGATYGIQLLAQQFIKRFPETPGIVIGVVASRSTGSGNFSIDYDLVLPGDICVWKSLSNGYNLFDYQSDRMEVYLYNGGLMSESNSYDGKAIELSPNMLNYLFSHIGDANTSTLTRTLTYNHITVTPRYELL